MGINRLDRVVIDNFRNIGHVEYDLARVNVWTGPNQQGKTNTILAIYWALTDYLMDGSSDYPSFKPLAQKDATVSVELVFDSLTIKKTYREKWTKTRGSDELILTGHETTYTLDGIKTPITNAKKEIYSRLGLGSQDTGKFDLLRAIVDPRYFGAIVDWKTLREFIIQICGDVSEEEIFAANPQFEKIRSRLETDGFDTSRTLKFYGQQAKAVEAQIISLEDQIKGLSDIKSPSQADVEAAQATIDAIDQAIAAIKAGNGDDAVQLRIAGLKNQAQTAKNNLEASKVADAQETSRQNQAIEEFIDGLRNELAKIEHNEQNARKTLISTENAYFAKSRERDSYSLAIGNAENELLTAKAERERLLARYRELKSQKPLEAVTCPHCGGILNQELIDAENARVKSLIDACLEEGTQAKANINKINLDIDNLNAKLIECENALNGMKAAKEDAEKAFSAAKDRAANKQAEINAARARRIAPIVSERTVQLQALFDTAEKTLKDAQEQVRNSASGIEDQIAAENAKKAMPRQVLNLKAAYDGVQTTIAIKQGELDNARSTLVDIEQCQMLAKDFIGAKLKAFEAHIARVFGSRMKFQLISENIKAGSWDPVCIPMIVDKETPYLDGSGSEQIITGIYFAECVKRHLGLPDLPYIFDECDKLDSAHMQSLETNAQIISTRVDDINYRSIHLDAKI